MQKNSLDSRTFLVWTEAEYPLFPYSKPTPLKKSLQKLFELWGFDPENPFKDLISHGGAVLIKPNWVRHYNPLGYNLDSLITHTSLITYCMQFALQALDGVGTIIIGDAPLQNCSFKELTERNHIKEVVEITKHLYPNVQFLIEDWRLTKLGENKQQEFLDHYGEKESNRHRIVNLKTSSFLEDIADYSDRFRVTRYKPSLMQKHHCFRKHEYLVTNRIFEVDLMINIAKMKTHIKSGMTGALKNLVGINGHKEFLPHHIAGSYLEGGDNYCTPSLFRRYYEAWYDWYWEHSIEFSPVKRKFFSSLLEKWWFFATRLSNERISAGSWRGNETVWRTTLDLNHLLYFHNPTPPRRILHIVDGIIAGEGEGPLIPHPKKIGLLVGGENPAYVDAVIARLMGYNISRIPTIYHALYHRKSQFADVFLEEMEIYSAEVDKKEKLNFFQLPNLNFKKPYYWKGASLKRETL